MPDSKMLKDAFAKRYPLETNAHVTIRECGVALCRQHLASGLGDKNAAQRLCSVNDAVYWQQLSEILLADQLGKAGLPPQHMVAGPDFLVEQEGRRIWVEVICPEPVGIPEGWLKQERGKVQSLPHDAMLLRWTAAIKQKSEKLIGSPAKPEGYLAKKLVAADDVYVIAINGRLLRDGFPHLGGKRWFL
jgi:hypothetical protein